MYPSYFLSGWLSELLKRFMIFLSLPASLLTCWAKVSQYRDTKQCNKANLDAKNPKSRWNMQTIWINWCIKNYKEYLNSPEEIINQNLWHKSNVKINKKTVHYTKLEEKGIKLASCKWGLMIPHIWSNMQVLWLQTKHSKDHTPCATNKLEENT